MATPHRGLIAVGDVANYRWDHLVLAGMRQRLAMVAIRALAAGAAARGGGSCSISLALIGQVSGKACCRHRWGNRCCPCGPTAINVGLHRSQIRGPGSIWTVCGRVFIPRPIVLRLPPDACAIGTSNARAICGFGFILCLFDPPGWEDPAALCLGSIATSIGHGNYRGSSTLRRRNVGGLSPVWRGGSWRGKSSETDFNRASPSVFYGPDCCSEI